MIDFLKDHAQWIIIFSILSFIATLILVPVIIIRLPADYFSATKRHKKASHHPVIQFFSLLVKNLLGGLLLLAGLIMLFTPGQGLITLLAGMMIMDYPGKYTLERWIILRFNLLKPMNWYRARHKLAPLTISNYESNNPT
jgi:Putative transmembrane protein (PGPGW)